jgi:hypothetical protein
MIMPRITLLVEISRDGIHYTIDRDDVVLDVVELDCAMGSEAPREPGEPWGLRRWPAVAVDAGRVAAAGGPAVRAAVAVPAGGLMAAGRPVEVPAHGEGDDVALDRSGLDAESMD